VFSETRLQRIGLVNNAADPGLLGPIAQLDARRLPGVFATNTVAPVWLMGHLVRHAPAAAAIRIVNVSSGAALNAFPGLGAYGASKAALRMAGMVLATELENAADPALRARDIAIVSYEPGTVDTPMQHFARSQPVDILPSREIFVRFATERRLVPPEAPAREIADFLEGEARQRFTERRFGASA
jgi:NAD(P)-dependent dehydrogenase (short-subunit alcohol dehydrogenase family)